MNEVFTTLKIERLQNFNYKPCIEGAEFSRKGLTGYFRPKVKVGVDKEGILVKLTSGENLLELDYTKDKIFQREVFEDWLLTLTEGKRELSNIDKVVKSVYIAAKESAEGFYIGNRGVEAVVVSPEEIMVRRLSGQTLKYKGKLPTEEKLKKWLNICIQTNNCF